LPTIIRLGRCDTLHPNLSRSHVLILDLLFARTAEGYDFDALHGVALFVADPPRDYGSGHKSKESITDFLAGTKGEDRPSLTGRCLVVLLHKPGVRR
jgi:hypothetical protein